MITRAITQTELRNNIKDNFDDVALNGETLIVHRGKSPDVVILPLEEYNSMMETFHLLKNENNRKFLMESIQQAEAGKTKRIHIDDL